MNRNWNRSDPKTHQMRYNGRYPINEMWDVRQSLIEDFRRNASTNKYLASIERKCLDFIHTNKQIRPGHHKWDQRSEKNETAGKSPEKHTDFKEQTEETYNNEKTNDQASEKYFNYINDYPCDEYYVDFNKDYKGNKESCSKNSEVLVKKEPLENDTNSDNLEDMFDNVENVLDVHIINDKENDVNKHIGSESGVNEHMENGQETVRDQLSCNNINCEDVTDGCSSENETSSFPILFEEGNEKVRYDTTSDRANYDSNNCDKIKNYKEFVKTVSKLVELDKKHKENQKTKRKDDLQIEDEVSSKSKEKPMKPKMSKLHQTQNHEKSKHQATSKITKLSTHKDNSNRRNTRSSSRSAKVNAVEKLSVRKNVKEVQKPIRNIKTRKSYSTRLRSSHEQETPIDSEREVTSTSKQTVKLKRKQSLSSQDDNISHAKYSKTLDEDKDENIITDKSRSEGSELDDTIVYSNCEDNDVYMVEPNSGYDSDTLHKGESSKRQSDFLKSNQSTSITNKCDIVYENPKSVDENKYENISDTSLIIIDEANADQTSDSKQESSTDLDSLNNNKDTKSDTDVPTSSQEEDRLWEYYKCDFCDFMVSKKKTSSFQLMEEHLESTKHNAASIVKVSIIDGELKPVCVKKEHAILFSLEKASVFPYCPTCCMVLPSIWTVQLHSKYKHGGQINKDVYCLGKVENVVNIPIPRKINMCKQCGQKKLHIQKHWKSHNHYPYIQPTEEQIALYSCNICHRHFESFFSALSHAVVHSQEKGQKMQNVGVKIVYISKSSQMLTLLPREKSLTSGRAIEMLNQARAANKTGQWTRAQRKEFEMMATEWKRFFK